MFSNLVQSNRAAWEFVYYGITKVEKSFRVSTDKDGVIGVSTSAESVFRVNTVEMGIFGVSTVEEEVQKYT